MRAGLRAVAADHHQTVDAARREVPHRLGLAGFLTEFIRARAAEKRTANLDDAADIARR